MADSFGKNEREEEGSKAEVLSTGGFSGICRSLCDVIPVRQRGTKADLCRERVGFLVYCSA
jgi:hypothetical protein